MSALRLAVFATLITAPSFAFAETVIVETGDDAESVMRDLQPGDELVFGEGTHSLGQGIEGTLNGQVDAPIIVRGVTGTVLESSAGATTLRLQGSNILLQDLEVQGPGVALALAGENIVVRGVTFVGATTGIECEDCASTTIRDCEFRAMTGENGAAVHSEAFVNGSLSNNWIHDIAGDGIVLVGRTVNADLSNNVIETVAGNGIEVSTPVDIDQENTVIGNYVGDVEGDAVIAVGAVAISTNIIANFGEHGIWATVRGGISTEATVISNTVVGDSTCFRGTDWSLSPLASILANNALYCPDNVAIVFDDGGGETVVATNVFVGGVDNQGDSVPGGGLSDFLDAGERDFYPAAGSPLLDIATRTYVSNTDFNGEQRDDTPDVGAYERRGDVNAGGTPGGGFKGETGGGPGGIDGGGGGGGDAGGTFGGAAGGGTSGFPEREGCSCSSAGPVGALFPLFVIVGGLVIRRRRA